MGITFDDKYFRFIRNTTFSITLKICRYGNVNIREQTNAFD